MAASMPRPSRSSLISLIVSTSRLSYWTTTRSGIVARSSGAMSMSGAAVTSMPPEWMERWRGKPSMRAQNSSQRSQSERPPVRPCAPARAGGSGSTRATPHDRVRCGPAALATCPAASSARPRSLRPGRRRAELDRRRAASIGRSSAQDCRSPGRSAARRSSAGGSDAGRRTLRDRGTSRATARSSSRRRSARARLGAALPRPARSQRTLTGESPGPPLSRPAAAGA